MRFSFVILFSLILFFSTFSCQKDKDISVSAPQCLNDTMDNYAGKYRLIEYFYFYTDSGTHRTYLDTFQTEIYKVSCKTLRILDYNEYDFSFDSTLHSTGKYTGTQYCHCYPELTFINKDTLRLVKSCGGGGYPCSLGSRTFIYDGVRLK
jgi:hypothetical protein